MDAQRRLDVISRQVTSALMPDDGMSVNTQQLFHYITADNLELRQRIVEFLKDDMYRPNYYQSLMEFREQTLQRLKKFANQRFFDVRDYVQNPRQFMAALESLAWCDYSLAIKAGVHFTLCGGTICKLGTKKHHDKYLDGMNDLSLPGCYGMTELAHGSNVMSIETTATYDAATQEFVINTPRNEASKFWIGGSAQHGKICTVFAQLTVGGKWEGPHIFVVRIRDDAGNIMPGIRIRDNGPKMGLNGVDNGQMWFNSVRVPRDNMLDKFASVDAQGRYSSSIPKVSQRFGTSLAGLTTGRIVMAQGAVDACKQGLTIALRYSASRTQFGDRPILDYVTHQRRLFPGLATTYALQFAVNDLKNAALGSADGRTPPADSKTVHLLSSGLKAASTWTRVEVLQACRECCGGMGFLAANKIGPMRTDMDVDTTFEGDNTVLMQQLARGMVEAARSGQGMTAVASHVDLAGGVTDDKLLALLTAREQLLTAQVVAGIRAASGGDADADAPLDAELDRAVTMSWARVERTCLQAALTAAAAAPPQLRSPLALLARLYGATRVERGAAELLAGGALRAEDLAAARSAAMASMARLGANGGALALQLCDAFGIPNHLLQAPIATGDWRRMGDV